MTLVTRKGCHLCEEALTTLRTMGVEPRLLDVDADPELSRLYDFRVPVLLADGQVLAEGRLDASVLRRALRERSGRQ
jgi:glutaredoxin